MFPSETIHVNFINNIITTNPRNVEYILLKKFYNYKKGKVYYAILDDLLGDGIFNDGDHVFFKKKMMMTMCGSFKEIW